MNFDSLKYRVKNELSEFAIQNKSILSSETRYFFICPTQKDIDNILAELSPAENKFKQTYSMMFDVADTKGTDFNAVLQNQVVSIMPGQNMKMQKAKGRVIIIPMGDFCLLDYYLACYLWFF